MQNVRLAARQLPTALARSRAGFGPAPAPTGGGSSMVSGATPGRPKSTVCRKSDLRVSATVKSWSAWVAGGDGCPAYTGALGLWAVTGRILGSEAMTVTMLHCRPDHIRQGHDGFRVRRYLTEAAEAPCASATSARLLPSPQNRVLRDVRFSRSNDLTWRVDRVGVHARGVLGGAHELAHHAFLPDER